MGSNGSCARGAVLRLAGAALFALQAPVLRFALLFSLLAPSAAFADADVVELDSLIAEAPRAVSLRLDRAEALLSLGRFEEALVDCDMAERMDPRDSGVSLVRSRIHLAMGELGLAERHLSKHLKRSRPTAGALYLRGSIREETGRFEEALADYQAAIALESDPELRRSRARMLRALGRLDDAVALLKE